MKLKHEEAKMEHGQKKANTKEGKYNHHTYEDEVLHKS